MATLPANLFDDVPIHPGLDAQVEGLLKVQKAAQRISSILDLDQLIDNIINEAARSFGLLETTVYLHDEARGDMVLGGVRGCTVHKKGFRLKVGKEGMVGYVASTGQMRYAPDVRKDPYYISCEPSTNSEVAIPLRVGERLVGVFTASHPDLDAFPRQQLRILQALCDHVAVAIDNARRFQSERDQRQAMSREAEEARAIQQALLPKVSELPFQAIAIHSPSCAGARGGAIEKRAAAFDQRQFERRLARLLRSRAGTADRDNVEDAPIFADAVVGDEHVLGPAPGRLLPIAGLWLNCMIAHETSRICRAHRRAGRAARYRRRSRRREKSR